MKQDPFRPKRRRATVIGEDLIWVPREDREWTPETPVKRFRVAGQARVTASQLRLRKEPNTSSETLIAMPQGAIVNVGPSNDPGWAYTEYMGHGGFASNQYLEPVGGPDWETNPVPQPPPPPPAPTPAQPITPPPAPPPPAPKGLGLAEKFAVAALVVALVGIPTYAILAFKKPAYT